MPGSVLSRSAVPRGAKEEDDDEDESEESDMELLASTINATLDPTLEGRRSVAGKGVAARGRDQGAMSFSQMLGAFGFRFG